MPCLPSHTTACTAAVEPCDAGTQHSILCLPAGASDLKEMLFFADQLKATGEYRFTFVVDWACADRWLQALRKGGHQVVSTRRGKRRFPRHSGDNWQHIADSAARPSKPSLMKRCLSGVRGALRWLGQASLVETLLKLLKHYRRFWRDRSVARRWLRESQAELVLVGSDRRLGTETALLVEAQRAGVPSLVIPYAMWVPEANILCRTNRPKCDTKYGMARWINRFVARLYPDEVIRGMGHTLLIASGEEILAAKAAGIFPPHPLRSHCGAGLATRVAIDCQYVGDLNDQLGVPREVQTMTGRASTDTVARIHRNADQYRQAFCEKYGLDPGKRILLYSVPSNAEQGLCSWQQHWERTRFLFEAMAVLENTHVVLNLHPKCDTNAYDDIAAHYGMTIAHDEPIEQVIPLCDVLMCTFSSTIVWAIGCGKPVVIQNFYGYTYPMYDACPGVVVVNRREDLVPVLSRIFSDVAYHEHLAAEQRRVGPQWAQLDDQCSQRLIAEVEDLTASASSRLRCGVVMHARVRDCQGLATVATSKSRVDTALMADHCGRRDE